MVLCHSMVVILKDLLNKYLKEIILNLKNLVVRSKYELNIKQILIFIYFIAASPLIKEMLTVNPLNRANISTICAHWWVNETYDESCLDISEELANLTPVRLDLLLSLAPPPPQLESEKLVVTGDVSINFTSIHIYLIFMSLSDTR